MIESCNSMFLCSLIDSNKQEIKFAMDADEKTDTSQTLLDSFTSSNLCRDEMKKIQVSRDIRRSSVTISFIKSLCKPSTSQIILRVHISV